MKVTDTIPYLETQFVPFTTEKMVSATLLLEKSVNHASRLPAPYDKTWKKFFARGTVLRKVSSKRSLYSIPEMAAALRNLKDNGREVLGVVEARHHSSNKEVKKAAKTLKTEIFPKGLKTFTDPKYDVVGWTALNLARMQNEYLTEVTTVRIQPELSTWNGSLNHLLEVAGEHDVVVGPGDDLPTIREAMDQTRVALGVVMVDLTHLILHQPQYAPIVDAMLKPLHDLTESVREEIRRNAKKAKKNGSGDGTANAEKESKKEDNTKGNGSKTTEANDETESAKTKNEEAVTAKNVGEIAAKNDEEVAAKNNEAAKNEAAEGEDTDAA